MKLRVPGQSTRRNEHMQTLCSLWCAINTECNTLQADTLLWHACHEMLCPRDTWVLMRMSRSIQRCHTHMHTHMHTHTQSCRCLCGFMLQIHSSATVFNNLYICGLLQCVYWCWFHFKVGLCRFVKSTEHKFV